MHEASLHDQNSFITLTYEDGKLPPHNSLRHRDFQLFMKRLRKKTGPAKVRFYMCGEYGTETHRPHYHAILFGYDWPDKKLWQDNGERGKTYTSNLLTSTWNQGHTLAGDVTFESAAYVARYCVQKVTGPNAKDYYGPRTHDYNKMSLRSAIGKDWFNKFHTDIYPNDTVIIRGKETKPPAYYDKLYERAHPEEYAALKERREWDAYQKRDDNTPRRLADKETVTKAAISQLVRKEI